MAQHIGGVYKLVTLPVVHRAMMFSLGAEQSLVRYANEILQTKPGMKFLDVGCGPANILAHLNSVEYTGVDLNEKHIAFARQRYGDLGRFVVGNAVEVAQAQGGNFDIINACALLHHLSDDEARSLLSSLRKMLSKDGQITTCDNVWLPSQRAFVKLMNRMDSGLNIRTPEQYKSLFDGLDMTLESRAYDDMLRIPYDHFCMIARPNQ
jgi:ubiquinone/menaquinone biosynthesis C-methylase UbiE